MFCAYTNWMITQKSFLYAHLLQLCLKFDFNVFSSCLLVHNLICMFPDIGIYLEVILVAQQLYNCSNSDFCMPNNCISIPYFDFLFTVVRNLFWNHFFNSPSDDKLTQLSFCLTIWWNSIDLGCTRFIANLVVQFEGLFGS